MERPCQADNPVCERMRKRMRELEAALRKIADEVRHAHDGAHILSVREICAKALSN